MEPGDRWEKAAGAGEGKSNEEEEGKNVKKGGTGKETGSQEAVTVRTFSCDRRDGRGARRERVYL